MSTSLSLITLAPPLIAYSSIGIVTGLFKFKDILNPKLTNKNKAYKVKEETNVNSIEVYVSKKNPPIYVGTPYVHVPIEENDDYNFLGSCGTFNNDTDFINYRYIDNPINRIFICDLTKEKYEDLLKKYDKNFHIRNLIMWGADKKLYLHEIKSDKVFTINDNKIGLYHESQRYLAFQYALYTRFPLTFTSGIIGGLILAFN